MYMCFFRVLFRASSTDAALLRAVDSQPTLRGAMVWLVEAEPASLLRAARVANEFGSIEFSAALQVDRDVH